MQEMMDGVFRDKVSHTATGFCAYLDRTDSTGFAEESFFDFTLGPLLSENGDCWGVLNFALDVTQGNLLKRRIELLARLAARGARAQSVEGVCHSYVEVARDAVDIPWMAVYVAAEIIDARADKDLIDDLSGLAQSRGITGTQRGSKTKFKLVSTSFDENLVRSEGMPGSDSDSTTHENHFIAGESARNYPSKIPPLPSSFTQSTLLREGPPLSTLTCTTPASSTPRSPSSAAEGPDGSAASSTPAFNPWPFLDVTSDTPYAVVSTPSPTNATGESIIFPIMTQSIASGTNSVLGFVVAGLNPHRLIDNDYLTFYSNVAKQLESGILNGKSRSNDRRTTEALGRLN